jgi:hypothetical protein
MNNPLPFTSNSQWVLIDTTKVNIETGTIVALIVIEDKKFVVYQGFFVSIDSDSCYISACARSRPFKMPKLIIRHTLVKISKISQLVSILRAELQKQSTEIAELRSQILDL